MLSCREVTEKASDYLERDLGFRERLQFRLHLAICTACRRYVEQLRAAVRLLKQQPPEPVPAAIEERVLDALRRHRDEQPRPEQDT